MPTNCFVILLSLCHVNLVRILWYWSLVVVGLKLMVLEKGQCRFVSCTRFFFTALDFVCSMVMTEDANHVLCRAVYIDYMSN